MTRYLLITTETKEGERQRKMVNVHRCCSMSEVSTPSGPRTLIKFFPDTTYAGDERPIFALESMDDIVKALGDVAQVTTRRRRR